MDDIPLNFIDRVFTKLNSTDIQTSRVQSPLWMKVSDEYNERIQDLKILLVISNHGGITCEISSCDHNYERQHYTIGDLIGMDDRFLRIDSFTVDYDFGDGTDTQPKTAADDLSELIRFISPLNAQSVTLYSAKKNLMDEFLRFGLTTKSLLFSYRAECEDFLKNQLQSEELERLMVLGRWPPELRAEMEAFVCRPTFVYLECNLQCLGLDSLSNVVDYWKTIENPLKSCIKVLHENLQDGRLEEFKSWLSGESEKGRHHLREVDYSIINLGNN